MLCSPNRVHKKIESPSNYKTSMPSSALSKLANKEIYVDDNSDDNSSIRTDDRSEPSERFILECDDESKDSSMCSLANDSCDNKKISFRRSTNILSECEGTDYDSDDGSDGSDSLECFLNHATYTQSYLSASETTPSACNNRTPSNRSASEHRPFRHEKRRPCIQEFNQDEDSDDDDDSSCTGQQFRRNGKYIDSPHARRFTLDVRDDDESTLITNNTIERDDTFLTNSIGPYGGDDENNKIRY